MVRATTGVCNHQGGKKREGLNGLVKDGGSSRREATKQLTESLGRTLEAKSLAFDSNEFVSYCSLARACRRHRRILDC